VDADIFLEVLPNENKIPAMFEDSYFVEAGGLMSYGSDYDEVARTAAVLVDKILRGAMRWLIG
jgi:putative tryptophan/tyrosine transport system substrate-binding protein